MPNNDDDRFGIVGVRTKLVKLICKKKWAKVKKLLKSRAGSVQARQFNTYQTSPLGIAVMQQPPLEIVEMLIAIDESLVFHMDCYGMIPLHIACRNGASSEVIDALLKCNNGAGAQVTDAGSRTPLHYCMEYICNPLYQGMQTSTIRGGDYNGHGSRDHRHHRDDLDLESSVTSLSTFQQTELSESGTILSMSPEEFEDYLVIVKELVSIAPNTVLYPDSNGDTPIDILQDCKATRTRGPKWERADIMCEYLRKNSVEVYKKEKAKYEMAGFDPRLNRACTKGSGSKPPSTTSTNASSTLSGYSQLGSNRSGSRGGISQALNSMVISVCDDALGFDSLEPQIEDAARK